MNAIVVYESIYGNTQAIAEAIAEGLGGAPAVSPAELPADAAQADLLVVGGPTHIHGMATARSRRAAAFDTRLDKPEWLTGAASHVIAKRLRRHGYAVMDTPSFLVTGNEGPLKDGELERARLWGTELAAHVADQTCGSLRMPGRPHRPTLASP